MASIGGGVAELVLKHLQLNFGLVDRDTCVVGKGGSAHTVIRSVRQCLHIFSSWGICENSYCHLGVRVTTALEERCRLRLLQGYDAFPANIDETAEKWNAVTKAFT